VSASVAGAEESPVSGGVFGVWCNGAGVVRFRGSRDFWMTVGWGLVLLGVVLVVWVVVSR
jgi:hypothetical protein